MWCFLIDGVNINATPYGPYAVWELPDPLKLKPNVLSQMQLAFKTRTSNFSRWHTHPREERKSTSISYSIAADALNTILLGEDALKAEEGENNEVKIIREP